MRERAALLKARNSRRASGEARWAKSRTFSTSEHACAGVSHGLRSKTHLAAYWDSMPIPVLPVLRTYMLRRFDSCVHVQQRRAAVAAGVANARTATVDARNNRAVAEQRVYAPTGAASGVASLAAVPLHVQQRLTRALSAGVADDSGAGGGTMSGGPAIVASTACDSICHGELSIGDGGAAASDGAMSESVVVSGRGGGDDAASENRYVPHVGGTTDAADPWPWCLVAMGGVDVVESLFVSPLGCVCSHACVGFRAEGALAQSYS